MKSPDFKRNPGFLLFIIRQMTESQQVNENKSYNAFFKKG